MYLGSQLASVQSSDIRPHKVETHSRVDPRGILIHIINPRNNLPRHAPLARLLVQKRVLHLLLLCHDGAQDVDLVLQVLHLTEEPRGLDDRDLLGGEGPRRVVVRYLFVFCESLEELDFFNGLF